jgi:hypothetical protein
MFNPNNIWLGVEEDFDEASDFGWCIRNER